MTYHAAKIHLFFSLASKSITVSWNLTIYQSVANDRHLVAWCNICGCFTRQVVGCKNTPEKMYKHIFLLYFWSNKCSLGEHKRILSKALKKSYWPQIFKLMCLYYIYIYIEAKFVPQTKPSYDFRMTSDRWKGVFLMAWSKAVNE